MGRPLKSEGILLVWEIQKSGRQFCLIIDLRRHQILARVRISWGVFQRRSLHTHPWNPEAGGSGSSPGVCSAKTFPTDSVAAGAWMIPGAMLSFPLGESFPSFPRQWAWSPPARGAQHLQRHQRLSDRPCSHGLSFLMPTLIWLLLLLVIWPSGTKMKKQNS